VQDHPPRFLFRPSAPAPTARPRIDPALHETRTLILVALVMFGFQYRAGFEPGLQRLPELFTDLKLGSMGMMLLSLALLAVPATYRCLAARRSGTEDVGSVASRSRSAALIPFAVSLGLDVTVAAAAVAGLWLGCFVGGVATMLAMLLWYGVRIGGSTGSPLPHGGRFAGIAITPPSSASPEPETKLDHVLAEIRLVLPGAQALLGFQFSVTLMQGFESVTGTARDVFLLSLGLIALATILLMTPSAVRRMLQQGERTERFQRLAGRMLVLAMAVLALALSGDVYVAASRAARLTSAAPIVAAATGLLFYTLWFGIPMLRRRSRRRVGIPHRTFYRG